MGAQAQSKQPASPGRPSRRVWFSGGRTATSPGVSGRVGEPSAVVVLKVAAAAGDAPGVRVQRRPAAVRPGRAGSCAGSGGGVGSEAGGGATGPHGRVGRGLGEGGAGRGGAGGRSAAAAEQVCRAWRRSSPSPATPTAPASDANCWARTTAPDASDSQGSPAIQPPVGSLSALSQSGQSLQYTSRDLDADPDLLDLRRSSTTARRSGRGRPALPRPRQRSRCSSHSRLRQRGIM